MLELEHVQASYDEVQALFDVTFRVETGEIVAIIGANGAGKTTTLRVISGLLHAKAGGVIFENQSLVGLRPDEIVRRGIVHVPEGREIFPGLTVAENLELGTTVWRRSRRQPEEELAAVFELFPRLKERQKQRGWALSGGEQQMLAIGRGLMARPRLLLLDEPSLGLAPVLVDEVFKAIEDINKNHGTTILLIEQNANMALELANRGYVLENGHTVAGGEASALLADSRVMEAYLGA